jgi:2-succinyl-5-enolpyruvyl-6-hydroxy-3-cyclohexene-1-carboxylate synthase
VDSPAVARAVVEELVMAGVSDIVVCPGSRSAPLALTLADAERRGLVRLHVRIDERSGAYLALGLARGSSAPVAVVTTSGTAAVNLHPAMVEAAYSGVPLVAITADRPAGMRGSGANQTIDQRALFGVDALAWLDLEPVDDAAVRSGVRTLVATAVGESGPVHLNVPLAEPLVAPDSHAIADVHPSMATGPSAPRVAVPLVDVIPSGVDERRGLLIVGDLDDSSTRDAAARIATSMGWPIISEPSGNLSTQRESLGHGPLLLSTGFAERHVPDVVVTIGRFGLHRSVASLVRGASLHIAVDVPPWRGRVDPVNTAAVILEAVPSPPDGSYEPAPDWLAHWRAADDRASTVIGDLLADGPMTGAAVAAAVAARVNADDLLVIGASFPVRHVSSYGGLIRGRCLGNRGTSGIDGVMSTAWGAALSHGRVHPTATTYALVGDLTALYDRNGLLAAPTESQPRLDYIVVDNDGGGIFSSLEQGADDFDGDFERVFGTPHGADLVELLAAPRVAVGAVETLEQLGAALASPAEGVRILVARCATRAEEAALVASLQRSVAQALA